MQTRRRARARSLLGDSRRRRQLRRRHVVLVPRVSGVDRAGRAGALRHRRRGRAAQLVPRLHARAAGRARAASSRSSRSRRGRPSRRSCISARSAGSCGRYNGEEDSPALKAARSWGTPLLDGIAPLPMPAWNSAFDGVYPAGDQWYWRGEFVRRDPGRRDRAARRVRRGDADVEVDDAPLPDRRRAVTRRQRRDGVGVSRRGVGAGHRRRRSRSCERRRDPRLGGELLRCASGRTRSAPAT